MMLRHPVSVVTQFIRESRQIDRIPVGASPRMSFWNGDW